VVDIVAYPADKTLFERDNTPIEDVLITIGGDAVNQAVALSSLGELTSLCCRVGDDTMGKLLLSEVSSRGVSTENIVIAPTSVTSTAIVLVAKNGDRNIICKKGNNYDFCLADIDMDLFANTKVLSVASLYGIPKLEAHGLLKVLQHAKANGALTFADMGSDKKNLKLRGLKSFLPYIDYFLPSEAESTHLTGQPNAALASAMFKDAGAGSVIIKLGSRGVYCDSDSFTGYVNPLDITPIDSTGAGDAFCAGFIHSILVKKDLQTSLEFASACGALATQYLGASNTLLSAASIASFINATPKKNLYNK
jgi:sugar/nucleoside kinase (ribokinase family)